MGCWLRRYVYKCSSLPKFVLKDPLISPLRETATLADHSTLLAGEEDQRSSWEPRAQEAHPVTLASEAAIRESWISEPLLGIDVTKAVDAARVLGRILTNREVRASELINFAETIGGAWAPRRAAAFVPCLELAFDALAEATS